MGSQYSLTMSNGTCSTLEKIILFYQVMTIIS